MLRFTSVLTATVLAAGMVGIAGCSQGQSSSDSSSSASASPSKKYGIGGLSSLSLVMNKPGPGKTSVVTGPLLNNGLDGNIVKASAPVATKGVVVMNGSSPGSIPVPPNGAKTSQTLTVDGYHLQLNGVDMSIDPDGQISLYLITDADQESLLQVKVKV
jgi:hypothetical protein